MTTRVSSLQEPNPASIRSGWDKPVRMKRLRCLASTGTPATLTAEARCEVLAHLLRLSDDDLRMRFLRCMPAAAVEAHVASIDFEAGIRLGVQHEGSLVAMAEGFVFDEHGERVMEVAFSTDPAWRHQGLARALGESMSDIAARRGVARIVAHCDARNGPMKSLLQAFDALIERDEGDLRATWEPSRSGQLQQLAGITRTRSRGAPACYEPLVQRTAIDRSARAVLRNP